MSAQNHILSILDALHGARVEYIVAGGVAVVLQGVERATMDIDLSLAMEDSNLKRFLAVMRAQGMVPRAPVSDQALLDPELRSRMVKEKGALVFTFIHPQDPFKQVDVFLAPELSYKELVSGSDLIAIGNISIRVLSKHQLIELKEKISPPREKDKFDISALRGLLKGSKS